MDDISEEMNCQKTTPAIENMEITIVHESPLIPQIKEDESVSQSDDNNLRDNGQMEFSDTDNHINNISKNSDCNVDIKTTDTDVICENTKDVDNHNSATHKDETLSHQIPETSSKAISSLSAIAAEYNSDTDVEDNSSIPTFETNTNCDFNKSDSHNNIETLYQGSKEDYRTKQKESSCSEDSDSDSDTDSDSSDSSDSSVVITSNDSDENNEPNRINKTNKGKPKEKELKSELDDLPPIEDLKISVSEDSCDPMGEVAWTVEQLVVVRPKVGKPTLNLDTVLFIDKGQRALGKIFDVFGQVSDPHYCVRFNSSEHIKENEIKVGMTVYYCPNTPYTSLVFVHELTKMKASDAIDDDEAPDFSDDEEERQYYENLRQKQVNETVNSEENIPQKRRRKSTSTWQSNHPWNRNTKAQNYKGRKHRGRNNDNSVHPNSTNPWLWSLPSYQYNSHYVPHFQQMHSAYGHVPYSDSLQVNSTSQSHNDSNKYNFNPRYSNSSKSRLPIPSSDPPFGIPFGLQPTLPICNNRHNAFLPTNAKFLHTNMYWQSQSPHIAPPWSLLSPPPPPPPPPAEENHDKTQ